jgi:hypothetical protein
MTSQATNRREGGSTSCPGHSRKLRAYTSKELETMRVAPELLGAPTIGGRRAQPGGGGGGGYRSQISPPSHPKYTKTAKNGWFRASFGL